MLRCGFQLHLLDVLHFHSSFVQFKPPVDKGVNSAFDLTFKATYFSEGESPAVKPCSRKSLWFVSVIVSLH